MLKFIGPGPGLAVTASKPRFTNHEISQLKVYKKLRDGSRKDLTSKSTGTKYCPFPGNGEDVGWTKVEVVPEGVELDSANTVK